MENFRQYITRPWIYIGFALIGILLKFYNIDYRYFWLDEISTIEQTSGLNRSGMMNLIPENEIINIEYYKSMLRLNEHELTIGSQLKSQAKTMNLNPLHYTLLTFWHRIAGDEPIHYRYFSLLIFLLTLPFLYLLAKKLLNSNLAGWIAVSIFCISPYIHYYSQEARYIILSVFLIIACNYFFLEALERKKWQWWLAYIFSGILALYSSIILGLLIAGHFIYILLIKKKHLKPWLISIVIIFLGYLPWFLLILNSRAEVISALAWHKLFAPNQGFYMPAFLQIIMMSRSFISFIDDVTWWYPENMMNMMVNVAIGIMILISMFYAKRKLLAKSFYLLLFLFLPTFLFFLISDLLRNAGSSTFIRYQYVNIVVAIFFVAFFFSRKIMQKKIFYYGLYILFIVLGLGSTIKITQNKNWNLYPIYDFTPANYINNIERYLIISDFTTPMNNGITAFLMLANEIKTNNVDILYVSPDNQRTIKEIIGNNYSEILVLYASEKLLGNLKSQFANQVIQFENQEFYNPVWHITIPSQHKQLLTEKD